MKLHQGVRGTGRARPFRQDELPKSDPMAKLGRRVQIQDDCWVVDGIGECYHTVIAYGSEVLAHRFVYSQVNDVSLGSDDVIHHRCEVKGCINPEHLQATTRSEHRYIHHFDGEYDDLAGRTIELDLQLFDSLGNRRS